MSTMKTGIQDEINRSRKMIDGALTNPKIMQGLAKLGYDRKEILRGKSILNKLKKQQIERKNEVNTQKQSTQRLNAAWAAANALYMTHVKYARMEVLPNSKPWNDLKLTGTRLKDMNGWLEQTQAFYYNVGSIADLLAQRGISTEELQQAEAMIEAVMDAQIQQNQSKSNKQRAKEQRDQDRKALQVWIQQFEKAVRYAFDQDKQQLEALGIVVASK